MYLNYDQCLTLLVIIFVLALVVVRALMAVVNRAFLVIDYAKSQLMGKGKGGGKFNVIQEIFGMFKPQIMQGVQNFLGGKKPQ